MQPPAYAIRKQILAVNEFVKDREDGATETIYEVHPELCFAAVLDDPPQYSKKVAHGVAERIEALDTISGNNEGAKVVAEALSAVKDNVDDDWEVTVDDGLLTGSAKHVAKQNAYEEAADMLEERVLQSEDSVE